MEKDWKAENWRQQIIDVYGEEYILRQLAEEAVELAQAALKMVRVIREESPLAMGEAKANLLEELADVKVMERFMTYALLSNAEAENILRIAQAKEERMRNRMCA